MDQAAVRKAFAVLWDGLEKEEFYNNQPLLLSHYTSLEVLESIMKHEEIWLSNPLVMNDIEEVRFGLLNGVQILKGSEAVLGALKTEERQDRYIQCIDHYFEHFEENDLLDTYIFCLAEHDITTTDGILSMWRGYGNNGSGVALVFDTSKIDPTDNSPLIIAKVQYASGEERLRWLEELAKTVCNILEENEIPDDQIHMVSYLVLERIKLFALFTKHDGFGEEREWRLVYMKDRDPNGVLSSMLGYHNGPRGVEPKLKFKIGPIDGVTSPDLTLDNILSHILLGPTTSTPFAKKSVERMLDVIGKSQYKDRIITSSIPFRHIEK